MNETIFTIAFLFSLIWTICAFSYLFYKRKKKGSIFPKIEDNEILYSNKTSSGNSHKSAFTKLGGANNCLKIIITKDEIWTTTYFPFSLLIDTLDLEHRIKKSEIQNIEKCNKGFTDSYLTNFKTEENENKTIQLYPKENKQFESAIGYKKSD